MPVKKGKVNEKVSTKVLAALSTAFGREISFVDDLTYSEYSTELREAMMRVHPDTGGEYADEETFKILSTERDRIRGKNTEKELETFDREPTVNVKKTKIKPSKFFDKGGKGGSIVKIGNSVTSIVETLKEDQKQDKKQQGWFRKMVERVKRRKKENKLEFRAFDGLKKTATKLLAPMKSAWSRFLDFIGKVILGRVLFKILTWMGDKKNQGKLKSIIKFFEDWWPAMLAGYLLFGNSLTSMVTGMLIQMGKWLAPMLLAIGKLMLNPWVAAAVGLGLTAAWLTTKKKKTDQNVDESVEEQGSEATAEDLKQEQIERDEERNPVQKFLFGTLMGEDAERSQQIERVEKMNKGGQVPGRGNTDTVPAMLTPGEFVLTKGAVQKYGVNTLKGMNAAAGGTNKPTVMRGYNEGGAATPMSTEDLVAAAGPSLQMFMEQNNAAIDSDPDAIYGEHMRMELDRDGKMINFGKTIANMSEWAFNSGVEQLQNNEAIDPDVKEALLKKMAWVRRETLENPNFKADMAFDINKDIPGTAANRLFLRAQADTTSPAAMAGLSARDRALQMNRMGYAGGGLVLGFQGGGQVRRNAANIQPRKTATVITPSEKKKVTVVYEEEKQKMANASDAEQSSQEIPQFDVTLGRSGKKIKVLGISV